MFQPIRGQGGHLVFPIGPKNTNLVEGVEILLPIKFSLNSVQRFQRRSRKCLSQSEARRPSCFSDRLEKHKVGRGRWRSCFLSSFVEFCSAVSEKKSKISANQMPGRPSCFSDRLEKYKLGRGRSDLASCQVSFEFSSAVSEKKSKMSQPIRGQGGHLVFPIGSKNTNLVEGVEILPSVKFR